MTMQDWHPFDRGRTVGSTGAEGGTIIRDDEHPDGARITLERDCLRAPYVISCGVYGFGDHTRFIADEPTAMYEYEQMQPALEAILALMPAEDDADYGAKYDAAMAAMEAFVERYR
jgi:hypothetical protein